MADERSHIARLTAHARTALPPGAIGPGDDAAVLPMAGDEDLVVSSDLVAEGVHFFPDAPPAQVGAFAAAANLSDLAAMGAAPTGFLGAYGAPTTDAAWLDGVAKGLAARLDAHDCPLLGGDTKEAATRVVVGTALGTVPRGKAVRRGGARTGDVLVVSGPVGGPAAALHRHGLGEIGSRAAMEVVLGVAPRLDAGRLLRGLGASAMVDLSDGLARAAALVADASGVEARLDAAEVPLDRVAADVVGGDWADRPEGRTLVLGVGGEYELLAAVPAAVVDEALERLARMGLQAARIGSCGAGQGVTLEAPGGSVSLAGLGWTHFG